MDEVAGSIPVTSTNFQFRDLRRRIAGVSVPGESIACATPIFNHLFQNFGGEAGERVVFHAVTDLNGIAAHFAIFDVRLTANR